MSRLQPTGAGRAALGAIAGSRAALGASSVATANVRAAEEASARWKLGLVRAVCTTARTAPITTSGCPSSSCTKWPVRSATTCTWSRDSAASSSCILPCSRSWASTRPRGRSLQSSSRRAGSPRAERRLACGHRWRAPRWTPGQGRRSPARPTGAAAPAPATLARSPAAVAFDRVPSRRRAPRLRSDPGVRARTSARAVHRRNDPRAHTAARSRRGQATAEGP